MLKRELKGHTGHYIRFREYRFVQKLEMSKTQISWISQGLGFFFERKAGINFEL